MNTKFCFQFGFRKRHSTYMALVPLMDNLTNCLDNGEYVNGTFLDFSKAVVTVYSPVYAYVSGQWPI